MTLQSRDHIRIPFANDILIFAYDYAFSECNDSLFNLVSLCVIKGMSTMKMFKTSHITTRFNEPLLDALHT